MRKRQKKPGKREIRSASSKNQAERRNKEKRFTKEEKQRLKELRKIKEDQQKKKVPHSAQDTIPYKEIYKDGICQTEDKFFSKTVEFLDINYQLAQNEDQEAIFENYCEFLNYFDSSVHVQLTFLNQQVNFEEYAKLIDIPPTGDPFDDIRQEYADILKMQLAKGNNGLVKTKYITFGIYADNLKAAKPRLERIETDIINNFKLLGVVSRPLNGVERLKILHDIFNMDTKELFRFRYPMIMETGLGTKDFIAPTGFDFRSDTSFKMGQTFACVSYLQITSPKLTDKMLADFLDMEENLLVNIHIQPIESEAAIKSLKSTLSDIQKMKIEEQKKAVRSGYDMDIIPNDIDTYGNDLINLLDKMNSMNEKMFKVTFLLMNTAETKKKLDAIALQTKGIAQKYNCNIRRLQYLQEQGMVASLPLGINQTEHHRDLTTTTTAIFVPFTTQELFMGGEALYYGLNALSNNMIMVDRKKLKTPNGLILGTPGSGKSFASKREIINVFLITKDDIIVCDPEGEYYPLVQALKGQVIKINAKSTDYINPMEVNLDIVYHPENYRFGGEKEDIDSVIADKAEFIISFCEVIMKKPQGADLDGDEISIIDTCVKDIYTEYLYNNPTEENMPILGDFLERLNYYAEQNPAARRVANSLELYVNGTQNLFNHRSNVDMNNRIVCFDIKELGTTLRKAGMLIVQNMVWTRVAQNRAKRKWTRYYVDEFHLLLNQPQTAAYSVDIWKRFRKWGGIPTGITQNVSDFLGSLAVENIVGNTEFIYMLNQHSGDQKILAEKLNISEHQLSFVNNSNVGEGLIFYGNVIIPFSDKYPTDTRTYALMSTKPDDEKVLV